MILLMSSILLMPVSVDYGNGGWYCGAYCGISMPQLSGRDGSQTMKREVSAMVH